MTENGRLAGKRALITGGGRGIGAAIASFLLSTDASYVTGATIDASGGRM